MPGRTALVCTMKSMSLLYRRSSVAIERKEQGTHVNGSHAHQEASVRNHHRQAWNTELFKG
ncbi:hypothetical protein PISMIDRAFT_677531 [Pisolithus microcarpus 441]|uniref:Uncharacterized protein n=1 Tax=Pisolithus microcarpus 441 TaxID=765257 RepID=A0A0C9Z729_9AGAM|nr:hypothetical protein PISMIDRAFT_677531 [Pisolithus microcarpus 441]